MNAQEMAAVSLLLATKGGFDQGVAESMVAEAIHNANETFGKVPPAPQLRRFNNLRDANVSRQQEMDPDRKLGLVFWSLAMAGEAGEVCNVVKKLERERLEIKGSLATNTDLALEVADVYIYLDLLCMSAAIDVPGAIKQKFNVTSEKLGLLTRIG